MDPQTLPLLPCPFCGGPVNLEKVHIRACSGWDQPMIRGTIIALAARVRRLARGSSSRPECSNFLRLVFRDGNPYRNYQIHRAGEIFISAIRTTK